jgi:hypothetical protein
MSKPSKEEQEILAEYESIERDVRSMKYPTEREFQAERLKKNNKRYKQYITGHGTGDN